MKRLGLGLALLVVAGCSGNGPDEHVTGDVADAPDYVTMNEEAAANDGLVARVILPNQVVEWYEPTAGMLIMSEAGIASDDIASITSEPGLQDMMPTELYEFLSDKPAPQALRDIEANALGDLRLTAFTGIEPGELTTPSGAALAGGDLPTGQVAPGLRTSAITNASGTVTNSCEESWFRTKFCSSSGYDVTYCRPNLYNVEWWADIYDLEVGGAGACSKSGTISIKANFTCNIVDGLEGSGTSCRAYTSWGPYSVPAGSWRSFKRTADYGGVFDIDDEFLMSFDVYNSSSDIFSAYARGIKD